MARYLFSSNDPCENAYILKSGEVSFALNENDCFSIPADKLIVGAVEVLLAYAEEKRFKYLYSVSVLPSVECVTISSEKLLKLSREYNVGFALARSIAELLLRINHIFSKKRNAMDDKNKKSQEYCKLFTWVVDVLESLYQEKRYYWLKEIIIAAKYSLTYHKGVAFVMADSEGKFAVFGKTLNEFSQFFPAGSVVCEEGGVGDSLYILQKGKLDVRVGVNSIGKINKPGSVIGEMALLLSSKRNATVKVLEDATLTIIRKQNLKSFINEHPDFLQNLSVELSKRVKHTIQAIESLNEWSENQIKKSKTMTLELHNDEYYDELKKLHADIKNLYEKYDMDWISDLLDQIIDKLMRIKTYR